MENMSSVRNCNLKLPEEFGLVFILFHASATSDKLFLLLKMVNMSSYDLVF